MSSLSDSVPPAVPATTPAPAVPEPVVAEAPPLPTRPPRTWYFLGTTIVLLLVYAVDLLAQLATLIGWLGWHEIVPESAEEWHALLRNGALLGLAQFVACPFVLAALWIAIRIARQRFSDYLALRRPSRAELARGLAMMFVLLLAWHFLALALGERTPPEFAIEIYRSARADGWLVVLILGVCVAAPVMEELVVRGFLFRGWSQSSLGPVGAIVLSSAAWAAIHTQYDLFYLSEIFAIGLLLGYLRYRSGSTLLTVVIHGAVNLASMIEVAVVLAYG